MNNTKSKAIILCRVSSKEQEETGYSLPAQEKFLGEYGERKNFAVAKIFSISESASGKKQRDTFNEMMEYTRKNNIKIIICEKVDRFTRNYRDAVMIDDWLEKDPERQIHLVKDSLILHKNSLSQEKLNWGMRILIAKNYIDNLSEEVKKGQKEKVAQGWLPTKPPVGYKTIGEKGHKTHIIDDDKKSYPVKLFKLYSTGNYSLSKITDLLHTDGFRSDTGKKVPKSTIHKLLSNPFYIGKITWNEELYQGKHEPLISEEMFDRVQNVMNRKEAPKYSSHNYIFKRIFKCSECGGVITWETHKNKWYGHCNKYRPCSQTDWYRDEDIEKQLLEIVKNVTPKSKPVTDWVIKALKESHKDEIEYHTNTVGEINHKISTTQSRLDKIYEDHLDGLIDKEKYLELKIKYEKDEQDALTALAKHKKANSRYYDFGVLVLEVTKNALEILKDEKKSDELKREYYKTIFSDLAIKNSKIEYKYNLAFQIVADYNSKVANLASQEKKIFEPVNLGLSKTKNRALDPVRSTWLASSDSKLDLLWSMTRTESFAREGKSPCAS